MKDSFSSLTPKLNGRHPDDAFSTIPYEKGFQFLTFIESLVGNETWQLFEQHYIKTFEKKSITVKMMRDLFEKFVDEHFSHKDARDINSKIDWDTWLRKPGLPPVTLDFTSPAFFAAQEIADAYINGKGKASPEKKDDFFGWFVALK